jgi:hypothetical protein
VASCSRCHALVHRVHDDLWPDDPWAYADGHLADVTAELIARGWWRRVLK